MVQRQSGARCPGFFRPLSRAETSTHVHLTHTYIVRSSRMLHPELSKRPMKQIVEG